MLGEARIPLGTQRMGAFSPNLSGNEVSSNQAKDNDILPVAILKQASFAAKPSSMERKYAQYTTRRLQQSSYDAPTIKHPKPKPFPHQSLSRQKPRNS